MYRKWGKDKLPLYVTKASLPVLANAGARLRFSWRALESYCARHKKDLFCCINVSFYEKFKRSVLIIFNLLLIKQSFKHILYLISNYLDQTILIIETDLPFATKHNKFYLFRQ